jgi:gentisate 1,2-dioxygenase
VREAGSSVYQVFQGGATVSVGDATWPVTHGDLFVVPSWQPLSVESADGIDLFRFSDTPVLERLNLHRRGTAEVDR